MRPYIIGISIGMTLLGIVTSCRGKGNEPVPPAPPTEHSMSVQGDSIVPWTTSNGSTEVAYKK